MLFRTTSQLLSRRSAIRLGSVGLAAMLAAPSAGSAQARELSTLETNKAIARDLLELAVNVGNEAQITAFYAPTYVDRGAWARQLPGPLGMSMPLHEFREQFPGIMATVENIVAEEDLVTMSVIWWEPHPPSGTHVVGRTMHLLRVRNRQIVEQWSAGWEWLARGSVQLQSRSSKLLATS